MTDLLRQSEAMPVRSGETASSAVAAAAQAAIQARYVVAMQRPRNWNNVQARLKAECQRETFAEDAEYSLPRKSWDPVKKQSVDTFIIGASIRFAEAALRAMTNVMPEVQTIFDDADRRIVKVTVTDLETNLTYSCDVVVPKTIERKSLKSGQKALASRKNSYGDTIYILPATEDEVRQSEGRLVSIALRNQALRIVPGDIVDAGIEECRRTIAAKDKKNPEERSAAMVEAFGSIGVAPAELEQFLGHPIGQTTADETKHMRGLFRAIRDGHVDWAQAFHERVSAREGENEERRQTAATSKEAGVNGRAATLKAIASARLNNPPRYTAVCEDFNVSPQSSDWQKDCPDDVLASFLAALQEKEGTTKS